MSDPIASCVSVVAGAVKDLVVDRRVEYVKFVNSYGENMTESRKELNDICQTKTELYDKGANSKAKPEVQ